jgi:hypothetical protein
MRVSFVILALGACVEVLDFTDSSRPPGGSSRGLNARLAMLHRMTFDSIIARCGDLLGRLRRGRQQDIPMPPRAAATSDPDLHPFELVSRDEIQFG